MVKKVEEGSGTSVYYCEVCGYGYADSITARECQDYCSSHYSCSLEITAKGIRRPDSIPETQSSVNGSRASLNAARVL